MLTPIYKEVKRLFNIREDYKVIRMLGSVIPRHSP